MNNSRNTLNNALNSLKEGKFVLIYDADGREEETDLIMAAQFVTPNSVQIMRADGGGLIFLIVDYDSREKLGLPFLADVFYREGTRWPVLKELLPHDIPYDTKSSFSVTINHRNTFTGITDKDRALTISEFARLANEITGLSSVQAQRLFGEHFRAPGHVFICASSKNPLENRFGHTELGVALVTMAGLTPIAVGCEMMDNVNALPKEDAIRYAEDHDLVFLEGKEIIKAWKSWPENA
ncbi:MAG: 3,4-dihydroxy-2-butanone-4-phosphate synthase [Candidatus Hodarchaeales archaeon]|jgi:3,4-dihydroxy 2-butanone 4-phosphate synthase